MVKVKFEDKTLACVDCGKDFVWTAGEQEFFAKKGFENAPKRCKEDRLTRKQNFAKSFSERRTDDRRN